MNMSMFYLLSNERGKRNIEQGVFGILCFLLFFLFIIFLQDIVSDALDVSMESAGFITLVMFVGALFSIVHINEVS